MRLLFFGTPEFAVPTLEALCAADDMDVVGVVSQPDRPRGRGRRASPSPVSALAERRGLPLWRPERVGDEPTRGALAQCEPDLGVVVAFGQFLPKKIRELPRLGYLVNAHASLLPRHRGAAPIARAILAGDRETGISVMRVEKEMDAGAVCRVQRTTIGDDEDAGSLGERLAAIAADAMLAALREIAAGRAEWSEQDHARATTAPKLEPAERELEWSQPAEALARRVRALAPTPGARTELDGETLRVLTARAEPGDSDRAPGVARVDSATSLRIATGRGWLLPLRLQRSGGRPLATAEFLRGRPISDGTRLGKR